MKTRIHYSSVLSATDGRLVSMQGMEGVYEVFEAVAGPGVTTLALLYLSDRVKEYLCKKLPAYARPEVRAALDAALDEWRAEYPEGSDRKAFSVDTIKPYLDRYVLPLLGEEFVEVEHAGEGAVAEMAEGYGDFLRKKLAGKDVIAVIAPNWDKEEL